MERYEEKADLGEQVGAAAETWPHYEFLLALRRSLGCEHGIA